MDDAADTLKIKNQILEDGSFADPPELRLLSDRGAWRKWERLQTLPSGDIKVKVICLSAGQSDVFCGIRFDWKLYFAADLQAAVNSAAGCAFFVRLSLLKPAEAVSLLISQHT